MFFSNPHGFEYGPYKGPYVQIGQMSCPTKRLEKIK